MARISHCGVHSSSYNKYWSHMQYCVWIVKELLRSAQQYCNWIQLKVCCVSNALCLVNVMNMVDSSEVLPHHSHTIYLINLINGKFHLSLMNLLEKSNDYLSQNQLQLMLVHKHLLFLMTYVRIKIIYCKLDCYSEMKIKIQ